MNSQSWRIAQPVYCRGQLHKLGLPTELDQHLSDAIERRSKIVHHMVEDPLIVQAMVTGEGIDAAVARVERLALDCAQLATQLFLAAAPWLEAMMGKSWSDLIDMFGAIDLDKIADPRLRQQIEAIRAMGDFDLRDLGLPL
jgi:hypothetical protein